MNPRIARGLVLSLMAVLLAQAVPAHAASDRSQPPSIASPSQQAPNHFGDSPFTPPEANDSTFVVDRDGGLDTGCTFRSGGPLVFTIKVNRVVGDVERLKQAGMIGATARLEMPAFDVDSGAAIPGINPERDRVSFNGNVVPDEFLRGTNNTWIQNVFEVPIEWVNFPTDPGAGRTAQEEDNTIRIDIDTANTSEEWCTSIDWAALTIKAARPVVMAHGILSSGGTWASKWVPELSNLGLPNSNRLNMGSLDSIANNATKIGTEVGDAKQRWGVDQVNLVCHSKGGLDSRHYVEGHEDVEQVIQIGTPNAGSPLADAVQAGSVALLGLGGTALANLLAGPAGIQLTTPYMAGYNLVHGGNRNVRYTALAGDYDPDCFVLNPFCRPLDRLLLGISGRGDTIVPIVSVHALSFTGDRTYTSSGDDGQAKHTQQTGSDTAFNRLFDRVSALPAAPARQAAEPLPLGKTASVAGEIVQGEVQVHQLLVDESSPVFFALLYPSGDLNMTLTSPSGEVFDPAAAAVAAEVEYDEGDILGGRMEVYNFGAPEVGTWTVAVDAPLVTEPGGSVGYVLNGWLEDPAVVFGTEVANPYLPRGGVMDLSGTLTEDGTALAGATVTATVVLPDDSVATLSLGDDGLGSDLVAGDGVYSGQFVDTDQAGTYRILVQAERTGVPGKPDFSREDFGLATVGASQSTFAGTFRDHGLDTDANGLFNRLIVEADLNITDAATYRVLGTLTDTTGNTHEASIEASLAAGPNSVDLSFDGRAIFDRGVNGPYRLSNLVLAEVGEIDILPIDSLQDAHDTAAYDFNAFEHASIRLNGTGTAEGEDTNGNGLYDWLNVSVGVDVDLAGFYNWSARLRDGNGTELGLASGSGPFDTGANTMTFRFAGEAIGMNGMDGPYQVSDLLLFGAGTSLVAAQAFTTEAFSASSFEGYTPPLAVTLVATDPVAEELGADPGELTITSDAPVPAGGITVGYSVAGSATPGSDYVPLSGSVVLPEGTTSAILVVTPLDDSVAEPPETVVVTLTAGAGYAVGTPDSATVTILSDDPPTVTIHATDPAAAEEGLDPGELTVFSDIPAPAGGFTVRYTVQGTASAGEDYVALSGALTIPAGGTEASIAIMPLDDSIEEPDETVTVSLASDPGYLIGSPDTASVTILSNELPAVTVAASDPVAVEANLDPGAFTLTRTGDTSAPLTVNYSISGTASAGSDYLPLPGTATLASGVSSTVIAVTPVPDALTESSDTIVVDLEGGAQYRVELPSHATVTIYDLPFGFARAVPALSESLTALVAGLIGAVGAAGALRGRRSRSKRP